LNLDEWFPPGLAGALLAQSGSGLSVSGLIGSGTTPIATDLALFG
jgi:hypothetical protein